MLRIKVLVIFHFKAGRKSAHRTTLAKTRAPRVFGVRIKDGDASQARAAWPDKRPQQRTAEARMARLHLARIFVHRKVGSGEHSVHGGKHGTAVVVNANLTVLSSTASNPKLSAESAGQDSNAITADALSVCQLRSGSRCFWTNRKARGVFVS